MNVNLKKAVRMFYSISSLEMVYFEAIANAFDAKGHNISIDIFLEKFSKPETLKITIKDNGEGFTPQRFNKFSTLFETDDYQHKGLGRLVYLNYFKKVEISSGYSNHKRFFTFNENFKKESKLVKENSENGSTLDFLGCKLNRIKTYDYVIPEKLKDTIIMHFFPKLYSLKASNMPFLITISLNTENEDIENNFFNDTQTITIEDLPEVESIQFKIPTLDPFCQFTLYYSICHTFKKTSINTLICIEDRTTILTLPITKDNIPMGYEIFFFLHSEFFTGKINSSRLKLELDDQNLKELKFSYLSKINDILLEKIEYIREKNNSIKESLNNTYPHLIGYFDKKSIGLMDKNSFLENAQKDFFKDQREIFEIKEINESNFDKSVELASRTLTEYIIYRDIIIKRLKKIDSSNSESDIHNLIVPMKKIFNKNEKINSIYNNNAWIIDDKFMTYSTILSDIDMNKLVASISEDIDNEDKKRPDIAIIFSDNPENINNKIDIVVIELKKTGLDLAKKEEVFSQLKQRARTLLNYYPNRIQRMWFYGIVDIDKELKRSLRESEFIELYSDDSCFYKSQNIIPDYNDDIKIPIGFYIMSFKSLINDAERRNSTFLDILKESIKTFNKNTNNYYDKDNDEGILDE